MIRTSNKRSAVRMVRHVRRFDADECGGAYTLSYAMAIPFLMLLVALVVETTLMMSAKLGTVYAAYAAARSASVYSSASEWEQARAVIERAARQAMVPFGSGAIRGSDSSPTGEAYVRAYRQWVTTRVSRGYVRAKMSDVEEHLSVSIDGPATAWNSDITAEVTYKFPFHVPGIGKLIGQQAPGGFVFPLTSRVVLQNEGPQNHQQDLGIGYGKIK